MAHRRFRRRRRGSLDAVQEFDDVTLRTVITSYLALLLVHSRQSVQGSAGCNSEKKKLNVKRSHCELEPRAFNLRGPVNTDHLSTEETHFPSDNYPKNIRSSHSQDASFVENVVIIMTALSKTSLPELQRKWLLL
ncbi:hypothetical protein ACTXT7_016599 [Hymenolepis weldensis]